MYDSDDGPDAGEGRGGGLWEVEGCVVASYRARATGSLRV